MSGSPVRRSDAPDASQSEICKQLARVVLDFAKPVFLTQPANRGIGIIVSDTAVEDGTAAKFALHNPLQVIQFLGHFAANAERREMLRRAAAAAAVAGGDVEAGR